MASEPTPWALTIPSNLRLLALARSFVEAVCQVCGLDESVTNAVVMAADEATNNVMRHAYAGRPDAALQIQCFFRPDSVEVRILDEGPPFDIHAVPQLDPAELRVGGRGVFLMRTLMDELVCEPRTPRGNTLRLIKRLRHPPKTDAKQAP
jgi:anti-sigma regulatory factor (Ser/Thr protein kinase)